MTADFSPSDYQVTVAKCNNGFIVTLFDPRSNPIRIEVVHAGDVSGYGDRALTPIILEQYEYADEHWNNNYLAAVVRRTDDTGNPTISEFDPIRAYPDGTDC